MSKPQWELAEWYRGCVIEQRAGMQRRGYLSIYHNWYREDGRVGSFVHHSLANARAHIDKLHRHLGDRIAVTEKEYQEYIAE